MPKRSQNAVSVTIPPPADALRNDLDRLAARIVARSLGGKFPTVALEPDLDTQIDALKTTAAYWGITRKGAGGSSPDVESAYEKYRKDMETGTPNGKANFA